jgi:formyltetrahydrofolate deformylase
MSPTTREGAEGRRLILTLSCPDRIGIVAAVANLLLANECNIIDSAQFGDAQNQRFFMRVYFAVPAGRGLEELQGAFAPVGEQFGMQWHLHDAAVKPRVLIMVSKFGHCLNDLLFRYRTGALPIVISAIVSNHRDFYQLAASHDIPFHHSRSIHPTRDGRKSGCWN